MYAAYHTDRYVYIETKKAVSEFYDLEKDPYQMTNEIDNPEYQDIIEHMKTKLSEIREIEDPSYQPSDSEGE